MGFIIEQGAEAGMYELKKFFGRVSVTICEIAHDWSQRESSCQKVF
jgi:hypothetical protein